MYIRNETIPSMDVRRCSVNTTPPSNRYVFDEYFCIMKLTHTLLSILLPFLSMAQFNLPTWKKPKGRSVQQAIPPNLTEFESEGPDGKTYRYKAQKNPTIRTSSGKTIKAGRVYVSDSGASVIIIDGGKISGAHQGGKKTFVLDAEGNVTQDTMQFKPPVNHQDEVHPPVKAQKNLAPMEQTIPAIPRDVKWGKAPVNKTVTGYWEVAFDLFQKYGSQTATHVQTIAALCRIAYQNEGVDWRLTRVMIWDTPDPYASVSNAFTILTNFQTANYGKINEHTAMFHNNKSFGGVAYVAGIHTGLGFGYTGWSNWSIPTSSNILPRFNWIVECSTHEIGHNFSMKHTHWGCHVNEAGTVVGRLDQCWTCEQCQTPSHPNCTNTTARNDTGTWMSYCHNNGAIDMTRGLRGESRAMMKDYLWNTCTNIPFTGTPTACTEWTYSAWGPCVNGVQTRTATGIPAGCTGLAPGPLTQSCTITPPTTVCVQSLQHYVSGNQSAYRFQIKSGCRYNVQYCRYDGAIAQPLPNAIPSACGSRLTNYIPTAAELSAGWIDRIASPQPAIRGRWYSIRATGSDGVTQQTFFLWP